MFDFLSDPNLPVFDTQDDQGDQDDQIETGDQLEKPLIQARKVKRREYISGLKREALNELIPVLPPPDTDLWVIGNGAGAEIKHGINPLAFDFGTFIPHVVRMLGDRQCIGYVSTWTLNETHVQSMIEMLTDGRLSSLAVMCDPYLSQRNPAIYAQLVTGLREHGGRFKMFKNHCKIIAIANQDGQTCVIQGSANLSAQPRTENYVLSTAPDLYQWIRDEFFERMLNRAERDKGQ